MRHRPALALVGLLALAACAGEAAPTIRSPFDSVSTNDPRELPANLEPGVIVVIGDEARFRTQSGSIVRFVRHAGEKEFPGCM